MHFVFLCAISETDQPEGECSTAIVGIAREGGLLGLFFAGLILIRNLERESKGCLPGSERSM